MRQAKFLATDKAGIEATRTSGANSFLRITEAIGLGVVANTVQSLLRRAVSRTSAACANRSVQQIAELR